MPNENKICRVCGFIYDDFFPWGESGCVVHLIFVIVAVQLLVIKILQ